MKILKLSLGVLFLAMLVGLNSQFLRSTNTDKGDLSLNSLVSVVMADGEEEYGEREVHECNCYVGGSGDIEDFCGAAIDCVSCIISPPSNCGTCTDTNCSYLCSCA